MKRILLSLAILGIVGAIITGTTTAIFSDEEVSSGNTFTAGAIDLQIDNESYYNGVLNEGTTWLEPADLDDENGPGPDGAYLFFDFPDLKPGDWGEDTISIHVENNESWLCVDVTLTSDDDNGSTEPELNDENPYTDGAGNGELADAVNFFWWADDGDNVYEEGETLLPAGPLGALEVGETATIPLADSTTNIWDGDGPFPGGDTRYIGKAWCFGDTNFDPYPEGDSSPVERPVLCDGAPLDNETQTDSFTADIAFSAVQSRNNPNYICEPEGRAGNITVTKIVVNEGGGSAEISDFDLFVGTEPVDSGVQEEILAGNYTVSEENNSGETYEATFGGNCDSDGDVTVPVDGTVSCTITNTFVAPGTITVDKIVTFSDEVVDVTIGDFDLFVSGEPVVDEVGESFAPGDYTISETYTGGLLNISIDAQFSGACTDDGDTGSLTLGSGESLTCTITNVITVLPPPVS